MQNPILFSEAEHMLILELLRREHRDLHSEIHHTDNRDVREELRERQRMVAQILDRVQGVMVR
jgi:hypothetical protein